MKILIIEDEIKTARELKNLLSAVDDELEVLDIVPSISSAILWFKNHPFPDLIFSDIQLADGLCFDIFKQIDVQAPVIFCTAYDEYAIRAFETNGIDYLQKPVDEEKLQQSLHKFKKIRELFGAQQKRYQQQVQQVAEQIDPTYKRSLLVHVADQIIRLRTNHIAFIYGIGGTVRLYTLQDQEFSSVFTLEQLEGMLDPVLFFRANRQFIVNKEIISGCEYYFNRRLIAKTSRPTPERIIISKLKAEAFLNWLQS